MIRSNLLAHIVLFSGIDLTAEATRESSSAPPPAVRSFSRDDPIQIPSPSQGGEEGIPPPAPELFGAPPPPSRDVQFCNCRVNIN